MDPPPAQNIASPRKNPEAGRTIFFPSRVARKPDEEGTKEIAPQETIELMNPQSMPAGKKSKRTWTFVLKESVVIACLLGFGYVLFSFYRGKAQGENALDRYISLRGYELSYLQAYQYLLIFFWVMVGIAVFALLMDVRERWELRDFKKMLARQRKGKRTPS